MNGIILLWDKLTIRPSKRFCPNAMVSSRFPPVIESRASHPWTGKGESAVKGG